VTVPDLREREFLSQYGTDTFGLVIQKAGQPTDAEGAVTLTFLREVVPVVEVFTRTATRVGTGQYEVTPTSAETSEPGLYTLAWAYTMDGTGQEYRTYLEIGQANPAYDRLSPALKDLVDSVWIRFADLFDHPTGGPNLQTYFQAHFDRGRMAQLMRIAVGRLNTMAQPFQTYSIDDGQGGGTFPVDQWGALLETATYVEALKHLIRSYVEQPEFAGSGAVSRLDRRDYLQRWQSILYGTGGAGGGEEGMLRQQLEVFKIANMGLGRPKVLVSGGVYGRYGPTRVAGSVAARPRYWTRFY
jgi:hypothetical protein